MPYEIGVLYSLHVEKTNNKIDSQYIMFTSHVVVYHNPVHVDKISSRCRSTALLKRSHWSIARALQDGLLSYNKVSCYCGCKNQTDRQTDNHCFNHLCTCKSKLQPTSKKNGQSSSNCMPNTQASNHCPLSSYSQIPYIVYRDRVIFWTQLVVLHATLSMFDKFLVHSRN